MEPNRPVNPRYKEYPFVKTHLLPHQLVPSDPQIPAVYLVRDGRDALVSIAHHRSDIIAPGSDFEKNLVEAIVAARGSFFGGWSCNVLEWLDRASIVIKFEDLIMNPIDCVERLRSIIDLPEPDISKLPTFNDLRSEDMPYGRGAREDLPLEEKQTWREKFFRRGRVGGWKDEMPLELHELFWELHGHAMRQIGYDDGLETGVRRERPRLGYMRRVTKFLGKKNNLQIRKTDRNKVLVEASVVMMGNNDGCERYAIELLRRLLPVAEKRNREWEFHVHLGMKCIFNILEIKDVILSRHSAGQFVYHVSDPEVSLRLKKLRMKNALGMWAFKTLPVSVVSLLKAVNSKRLQIAERGRRALGFHGYELIHLTVPQTYWATAHYDCKFMTTVHDLSHLHYPRYHIQTNVAFAEEALDFAVRKRSSFIAVSDSTRKDLLSVYGNVDPETVVTIYEGVDHEKFRPITDERRLGLVCEKYGIPPGPYLLSLSTLEPRKNIRNTIAAFLRLVNDMPELDTTFVIAGKRGWKYDDLFNDPALQSDRVVFTGFIDEEDLPVIYSGALALCYISHYEGFGLPPVEAMACGTPVIYGDNSSMPEVIADGGLPADPADIEDIKEKLKTLILSEERRSTLSLRALRNAKRFSWDKTLEDTLDAYRRAITS
jgi:glycosyltransferase involved in cell wall biosynthesis